MSTTGLAEARGRWIDRTSDLSDAISWAQSDSDTFLHMLGAATPLMPISFSLGGSGFLSGEVYDTNRSGEAVHYALVHHPSNFPADRYLVKPMSLSQWDEICRGQDTVQESPIKPARKLSSDGIPD
jgi:hypothetical protein